MWRTLAFVLFAGLLAACAGEGTPTSTATPTPTAVPTPTPTPTPSPELIEAAVPTTKLVEMLGQAPDIGDRGGIAIFVDQRGALDAFGFQGITSWEAFYALPEEEKVRLWFSVDRSGAGPNLISRIADYTDSLEEIVGFSYFQIEASLFLGQYPTIGIYMLEGMFDMDRISTKLRGAGYETSAHRDSAYYTYGEDLELSRDNDLARFSQGAMNRVALLGTTIITSSITQLQLSALDARANDFPVLGQNPAYLALANSMGPVLAGGIYAHGIGTEDYIGIGYKSEGGERFLVLSLLYRDPGAAELNANSIRDAMKQHVGRNTGDRLEGDLYVVGQSRVDLYSVGSVLTIEAKLTERARSALWGEMVNAGDLALLRLPTDG